MNRTKFAVAIFLAALVAISCKEASHHNQDEHNHMMDSSLSHMKSQTKVVVVDGIQFAFDMMPIEGHMKMMEEMHMKMKHHEGATHGLMITVMNKKTNNLIKNASVDVTVSGQTGESFSKHCEEMTGSGMHHYGTHLKLKPNETYKVKATAKISSKSYEAEADFTIE